MAEQNQFPGEFRESEEAITVVLKIGSTIRLRRMGFDAAVAEFERRVSDARSVFERWLVEHM